MCAARLRTIKADIAANLGDCELNVTVVAARHGVTPPAMSKKLFASEGVTFLSSDMYSTVASCATHRLLKDPRLADRLIASVAFDCRDSAISPTSIEPSAGATTPRRRMCGSKARTEPRRAGSADPV